MINDELIIRQLLDKFMDGQTTVDDERRIAEWFRSHKQVSPDLEDYRTMFAWFDEGMPLDDSGDMALAEEGKAEPPLHTLRIWLRAVAAVAAAVAIVLMMTLVGGHEGTPINNSGRHTPVVAVTERHDSATSTTTERLVAAENAEKETLKTYVTRREAKRQDSGRRAEENINSLYNNVEAEEADSVVTAVTVETTPPPTLYAQAEPEREERPVLIGETVSEESRKRLMPLTAESLINMAIARMESQQNELFTAYAQHTEECERIVDGIIRGDGMTARQEEEVY